MHNKLLSFQHGHGAEFNVSIKRCVAGLVIPFWGFDLKSSKVSETLDHRLGKTKSMNDCPREHVKKK